MTTVAIRRNTIASFIASLILTTAFVAVGLQARSRQAISPQRTATEALGGDTRYRVHTSTDKPVYRLGEKVYVRGVILDAKTHRPLEGYTPTASIKVKGPKGETVTQGSATSADSVIGFGWQIPDGLAGGEYKVELGFPGDGLPTGERKFEIRAYRPPRLKSQIVFVRDGYGPGDKVQANLHTERAEGGFPTGAKVTVTARVDGEEVHRGTTAIDHAGNCSTEFVLPMRMTKGDGTLAMAIEDGGVVETATKTIPILLQTLDLVMYPEGGDLVAGLPNRVYIQARTPSQKPADLEAIIVDPQGKEMSRFATTHEGRGVFEFTPQEGVKYNLKVIKPTGINAPFPLPATKDEGVVLRASQQVVDNDEQVVLLIGSTATRDVLVTVSKGERDLGKSQFLLPGASESGPHSLTQQQINIPWEADGVLVATVWSDEGQPLAERLIFREPARALRVSVHADKKSYVPGGKVKLTIKTTSAQGAAVPAVVGLAVTDDSVLEMIEKREHAPRLPVMVFLEDEVRDLADAHVYLDDKNPKAAMAVDLLLGTQGWRRFAHVDASKLIAKHGEQGRRALVHHTRSIKQLIEAKRLQEKQQKEWAKQQRNAIRQANKRRSKSARGGHIGAAGGAPPMAAMLDEGPMMAEAAPPPMAARPSARAPAPRPPSLNDAPMAAPKAKPSADAAAQGAKLAGAMSIAAASEEEKVLLRPAGRAQRAPNTMLWVREFAYKARPERKQGDRIDFTETVYWHAGVKTNASGMATVNFELSDSVTAFRATADAFDSSGRIGTATTTVESVEPFYIEPKVPLQVTSTDVIRLPVAIVNSTPATLTGALEVEAAQGIGVKGAGKIKVASGARDRQLIELSMGNFSGTSKLTITAAAGNYSDKVEKVLDVQPLGFPGVFASSGILESGKSVQIPVELPQETVAGSVQAKVSLYPTPLANLTGALARLMREPNGCFEQTSSSNYPLVMAQQYFMSHRGVEPSLIERSRGLLERGYQRLTGFECSDGGYEWFGENPGHEALSAYGLMEFADMAGVMQVDGQMLDRTRDWLMARRDGQGRFTHARRALHTWMVDPDCHTGYITWALLESGAGNLNKEIAEVKKMATNSDNSYVVALGANVLAKVGNKGQAQKLMKKLVAAQVEDGSVGGATTSIVGSRGESLTVETTALATLAWLTAPAFSGAVEKSIRYLASTCEDGRYGSTQATVLALKAIVAYDKARSKPKKGGTMQLLVDGKPVGKPFAFTEETQGAITLDGLAEHLKPGRREVTLSMTGGASMPYSVDVQYNTLQPLSSPETRIHLTTTLRDRQLVESNITEVQVTVVNTAAEPLPTPVAIIGIPGGLEVRHDQLKELKKANRIAAYEVRGRDVVLYWRELAAKQKITLPVSLVAAVPGSYTGAASRAYEYYGDEYKHWAAGMKVEISPKR